MSSVAFRNVSKSFPSGNKARVSAVEGVSFRAEPGEFLALLGPSGCGKTTLLRMLAGLETADRGDILIGDVRVNDVPASKRKIAMVFQNYALYPHLSVRENIIFGLKVRKMSRPEREQRLEYAAGVLGLDEYLDRRPSELSGGQRQRVALGRAIVSQAQIVLMDEPLSNLDAKLRGQMRVELRDLQRRLGLTVVYVTHDQVEAMTMADKVVVMRRGHVEQVGSPIDIYREPATTTVASFVGAPPMNLLPATVVGTDVRVEGAHDDWLVPVPVSLPDGAAAMLGVRAESLTLTASAGQPSVTGKVLNVEHLGADTLVTMEYGPGLRLIARVLGIEQVELGAPLTLHYTPDQVRVFDAETGHRAMLAAPATTASSDD